MQKNNPKKKVVSGQTQSRPGLEYKMSPPPVFFDGSKGTDKLLGKKCLVTGGDSGIGRAVAVAFAKEGADVAIIYLNVEEKDALRTAEVIEQEYNRKCLMVPSDLSEETIV